MKAEMLLFVPGDAVRKNNRYVRILARRDKLLGAAQNVFVAIPDGSRGHCGGVGPAVGFGERKGRKHPPIGRRNRRF
jgi:hypothetical protein